MAAALIAAFASGEPLLAHLTQVFMVGAAQFLAQFFPLFLLGALFGKLTEDSGSVEVIARFRRPSDGPPTSVNGTEQSKLMGQRTSALPPDSDVNAF